MRRISVFATGAVGVLAVGLLVPAGASALVPVITVGQCTETALRAAIADVPDGGTVDFGCDGTITLTQAGGSTIETHKTLTLDGSGHHVRISGGGYVSLFFASSADSGIKTFTVKHLTLADGSSQDFGLIGGGAIYNANAHVVAEDVTFSGNHAFNYGGALYNFGTFASATISHSRFVDNLVTCTMTGQGGGAIASFAGGATTVTDSVFTGNGSVGGSSGGAILGNRTYESTTAGPISISGSAFQDNYTNVDEPNYYDLPFGGGAVAVYNHPLTISGSTFTANYATTDASAGFGGAVLAWTDTSPSSPLPPQPASISTSTFRGNLSEHNNDYGFGVGGALALLGPPATISHSHFDANAAAQAGAIFNTSTLHLTSSTLTGNNVSGFAQSPPDVGGLVNEGDATVSGTTFLENPTVNCASPQGTLVDGGGNVESPGRTCFAPQPPAKQPVAGGTLSGVSARTTPGAAVKVSGTGYAAFSRVAFVMYPASTYSHPVSLGFASADGTGTVQSTLNIPTSTRGLQTVLASGADPNVHTRYLQAQTDVEPSVTFGH